MFLRELRLNRETVFLLDDPRHVNLEFRTLTHMGDAGSDSEGASFGGYRVEVSLSSFALEVAVELALLFILLWGLRGEHISLCMDWQKLVLRD